MSFPATRMRRMRRTEALRELVRETDLRASQLVQPLFVTAGERAEIAAMPGVERLPVDDLVAEAASIRDAGVSAVLLFGVPGSKDEAGSGAYDEDGIVQTAIRALKSADPGLLVIADTCLCEYTSHGHCGYLRPDGEVDNDLSLELVAKTALSQAAAGADVVAPSDMMDGRVAAIREQLDGEGQAETAIFSYAVKYASAFYGPFREAAGSAPAEGDRRGYQMDPANSREAVREARLDLEEGADLLIVKPGLPCLDVIRAVRDETEAPLAAYQVSGEYAMLAAASATGGIDERAAVLESLLSMRRAGADVLITYYAKQVAEWLSGR